MPEKTLSDFIKKNIPDWDIDKETEFKNTEPEIDVVTLFPNPISFKSLTVKKLLIFILTSCIYKYRFRFDIY